MTAWHGIVLKSVLALSLLGLGACESRVDSVNQKMKEIQAKDQKAIKEPILLQKAPQFRYSAPARDPFQPAAWRKATPQNLADKTRALTHSLQDIDIQHLQMKGVISKSGQRMALLQSPDGELDLVGLGSMVGPNQGRVRYIDEEKVGIVEVIGSSKTPTLQYIHRQASKPALAAEAQPQPSLMPAQQDTDQASNVSQPNASQPNASSQSTLPQKP